MNDYINQEEGMKRVMNNKKLYIQLLTKFRNKTNFDELLSAIEAKDYEEAEAAAHSLKGLSGNLSLTALYELMQDIDAQLKQNTLNPGAIEALTACFHETIKAVDEVIAANE